jgi:type I restriction enzyme S subunit
MHIDKSNASEQLNWLSSAPSHWKVEKLKYCSSINLSNVDKKSNDDEINVLLCNYVDVYKNQVIDENINFMPATAKQEQINNYELKKDDVLLTKDSETPDDIAVPSWVLKDLSRVLCGYHLALIQTHKDKIFGKYLAYLFESNGVQDYFYARANGVTRFSLSKDTIRSLEIFLPPLNEQQSIIDFLDDQTSKIDSLIANKKKLIDLLEEQRQAIITEDVTKGLDPNVKMQDSGVEWIGEIPEHWRVMKIKRLTKIGRGASPRPIDDPKYFDENGEYAWVRISDVTRSGMYLKSTEQRLSNIGANLSVKLQPGSLFLSIAASVGKPCITSIKCCIHDGFVYFLNYKENIKFLYYIFDSGEPYKGLGKLGTQLNLNRDTVGMIAIPVPPLSEQDKIVECIDKHVESLNTLMNSINEQIIKLQEYRQSLIYEAVTGKIDVRDYKKEEALS